jgi:hypothetical protein
MYSTVRATLFSLVDVLVATFLICMFNYPSFFLCATIVMLNNQVATFRGKNKTELSKHPTTSKDISYQIWVANSPFRSVRCRIFVIPRDYGQAVL